MDYLSPLFGNTVVLILAAIALIATVLYLREAYLRKNPSAQAKQELDTEKRQGVSVIAQAIQKSQDILKAAQFESAQVIADNRTGIQKLQAMHEQELAGYVKQFEKTLANLYTISNQAVVLSGRQYTDFLQELKKRSEQIDRENQQITQQKINQLFESLETKLSDFLVSSEQKTMGAIELELKSARELIDTYKQQQLRLIDENIVAMMEQTLNLVLGKKLSMKDQLDLIYESLEKAKLEKFIV